MNFKWLHILCTESMITNGMRCGVNCLLTEHVKLNIYDKHQFNGHWDEKKRKKILDSICSWSRPTDHIMLISILFEHQNDIFTSILNSLKHFRNEVNQCKCDPIIWQAEMCVCLVIYRCTWKYLNEIVSSQQFGHRCAWKHSIRKSLVAFLNEIIAFSILNEAFIVTNFLLLLLRWHSAAQVAFLSIFFDCY